MIFGKRERRRAQRSGSLSAGAGRGSAEDRRVAQVMNASKGRQISIGRCHMSRWGFRRAGSRVGPMDPTPNVQGTPTARQVDNRHSEGEKPRGDPTPEEQGKDFAAVGTASIVGCDGCCLTRLIPRRGPRKTDTIGVRPVLPRARKRQRFRNRCHDRLPPQSSNVQRQRENARSAYYDDGKREKHFLMQSHLLTPV